MADITKIKVGVCSVVYKGVDLGLTIGGVEVSYEPDYYEVKPDQYAGPGEYVLKGEKLIAKVPLAEYTLANLDIAIQQSAVTNLKLQIGNKTGKRASSLGGLLVLHPQANAANDKTEDIGIYKAVVTNTVVIAMKNDGERILQCEFTAVVDEGRVDGNLLGVIGDSTT